MPHDEPDETDPMMLVGVELPADELASLETAMVFAEEFARMGFGEEKLMGIFRNPFYAAAHKAYLALGAKKVAEIVRENVQFWGAVHFRERDTDPTTGIALLPVLEKTEMKGHA
ncbi:MAG TPA: hypothetical protein VMT52_15005 [Planctomycetota bacterium]|nr:hypothetical protein [Planctomycetota bacterium]